jgi:hypothetical protein
MKQVASTGDDAALLIGARLQAAVISVGDLQRLERSAEVTRRLACTLGQSPKLIEELKMGKVHPAMATFGLWKDEDDLSDLEKQIMNNRQRTSSRSAGRATRR